MDFKGITWAGNIYQRFEAMCLEVEEAIYEDTVKYMESQAHKVGGSVKKFYSEMMEDLLPPSCIGPEQNVSGDYLLNSYDISKKPRLSISDTYGQLKKNEIDDISEEDLQRDATRYSPPPVVFVESIHSDGCSTASKNLGAYRRPVGVKRISRSTNPPNAYAPVHDRIRNLGEAANKSATISATSFENTASKKTASTCVHEPKGIMECNPVACKTEMPIEAPTIKKPDDFSKRLASSDCLAAQPNGISFETHDINLVNSAGHVLSKSFEGKPMTDSSRLEADPGIRIGSCNPEPAAEELILTSEDKLYMEAIENSAEAENETLTPLEMSKLEETCVFVEATDPSLPQGQHKSKPYKKKIREALASKLRLKKKQPQMVEMPHGGSSESEWEIL